MLKNWIAGALILCAGSVSATPMYYTFTGNITNIYDGAGIVADAGVTLDTAVKYTYLIDFDAAGTHTYKDGSTNTRTDTITYNYFYSDFISGSLIEEKDGGYLNDDGDIAEYNHGYHYKVSTSNSGYVYGESGDEVTNLHFNHDNNLSLTLSDIFSLGMTFTGFESAYDSTGAGSYIDSALTLTDISETYGVSTVPVPAAAWLFGSALLGFFGFSRRKTKA